MVSSNLTHQFNQLRVLLDQLRVLLDKLRVLLWKMMDENPCLKHQLALLQEVSTLCSSLQNSLWLILWFKKQKVICYTYNEGKKSFSPVQGLATTRVTLFPKLVMLFKPLTVINKIYWNLQPPKSFYEVMPELPMALQDIRRGSFFSLSLGFLSLSDVKQLSICLLLSQASNHYDYRQELQVDFLTNPQ